MPQKKLPSGSARIEPAARDRKEISRRLPSADADVEVVDLPSSTYYYQSHKIDDLDARAALEAIAVQYPRYGSRRLTEELKRAGWQINRKRVQRLMQEENLLVQVRRYCRTTKSEHGYGHSPNLIKHLEIVKPDQVWCADLTYIRLPRQFVSSFSDPGYLYAKYSWMGEGRAICWKACQERL